MADLLRRDGIRQQRYEDLATLRNQALAEDHFRTGLSIAARRMDTFLLKIRPGKLVNVLGDTRPAFGIDLADKRRAFGLGLGGIVLIMTEEPPSRIRDGDELTALFAKSQQGAKDDEIDADIALAKELRIGAVATLMMLKVADPNFIASIVRIPDVAGKLPEGTFIHAVQTADGRLFRLVTKPDSYALAQIKELGGTPLHVASETRSAMAKRLEKLDGRGRHEPVTDMSAWPIQQELNWWRDDRCGGGHIIRAHVPLPCWEWPMILNAHGPANPKKR